MMGLIAQVAINPTKIRPRRPLYPIFFKYHNDMIFVSDSVFMSLCGKEQTKVIPVFFYKCYILSLHFGQF